MSYCDERNLVNSTLTIPQLKTQTKSNLHVHVHTQVNMFISKAINTFVLLKRDARIEADPLELHREAKCDLQAPNIAPQM